MVDNDWETFTEAELAWGDTEGTVDTAVITDTLADCTTEEDEAAEAVGAKAEESGRADTVTVIVDGTAGGLNEFWHLPRRLGRQLEQALFFFTYPQPLQTPVRLHWQEAAILSRNQ